MTMDTLRCFSIGLLYIFKWACFVSGHCPSVKWMEDAESGKCYRYIKRSWDYDKAKTICRNLQGQLSSIEDLSNKSDIIRQTFRVKSFKVWANSDKDNFSFLFNSTEDRGTSGKLRRPCKIMEHNGRNRTHGVMSCRRKFPFVCEYAYEKGMSIKAIVAINISALIFLAFVLVVCASWIKRYYQNDSYSLKNDSTAPLVAEKLDMEDLTCDSSLATRETSVPENISETKKGKRVRWEAGNVESEAENEGAPLQEDKFDALLNQCTEDS